MNCWLIGLLPAAVDEFDDVRAEKVCRNKHKDAGVDRNEAVLPHMLKKKPTVKKHLRAMMRRPQNLRAQHQHNCRHARRHEQHGRHRDAISTCRLQGQRETNKTYDFWFTNTLTNRPIQNDENDM
jgi:hypothetical protein